MPAPTAILVLSILLAGGLLLSGALLTARFVPRLSAAQRRSVLLLALLGFVLLPFMTVWAHPEARSVPSIGVVSPTFDAGGKFEDLRNRLDRPTAASPGGAWLMGIWGAGAALLVLRQGYRLVSVLRLVRGARPDSLLERRLASIASEVGLSRPPRILVSSRVGIPLMWGPPWGVILIPEWMRRLSTQRLRPVLLHELGHLRRKDAALQILVDFLCAVLWFHPLVWMMRSRLLEEQEMACDDDVLQGRIRPSDYAGLLLEVATSRRARGRLMPPPAATLSMTGRSSLGRRIRAVLDPGRRRSGTIRSTTLAATLIVGVSVVLLAVAPLHGLPAGDSSDPIKSPDDLGDFLDGVFERQMTEHRVVGSVISVVKDGKIFFSRGYGSQAVDGTRAVDPARTLFRIGSISKVFTGVAVLQLVDQGLLSVDDDVNRHLRTFKLEENFPEPVRVRHLLTHTAGFDQLGTGRHVDRRKDEVSLAAFLEDNLVRVRPPGEVTCYDTYGVTLAGHLVETLSGMRFEEALRTKIFEPLGMSRTNIYVPDALKEDVAVGYDGDHKAQRWEFMNTNPASTVNSTAHDMAAFMSMFLEGGVLNGRRVLSAASTHGMLTRQFGNHPDLPGYTYLMFEDHDYGARAVSHGGSMTGYAALMYLLPGNRTGIFIALNRENGAFLNGVMDQLMGRMIAGGFVDPSLEKPKGPPLESFTGVYANNMYNHTQPDTGGWQANPFYLGSDGRRLTTASRSYERDGPLTFRRDDGVRVAFRQDTEGDITHMFIRQTTYERLDMTVEEMYGPRLEPKEIAVYEGFYDVQPVGFRVHVYGQDGYLWSLIQSEGETPERMRHVEGGRFRGDGFQVTFRMEDGRATGFDAVSALGDLTGTRVGDQ